MSKQSKKSKVAAKQRAEGEAAFAYLKDASSDLSLILHEVEVLRGIIVDHELNADEVDAIESTIDNTLQWATSLADDIDSIVNSEAAE